MDFFFFLGKPAVPNRAARARHLGPALTGPQAIDSRAGPAHLTSLRLTILYRWSQISSNDNSDDGSDDLVYREGLLLVIRHLLASRAEEKDDWLCTNNFYTRVWLKGKHAT